MFKRLALALLCALSLTAGDIERFPVGQRADLSRLGFVDAKGKKCVVGDFKGKVVVVDFWAVWCGPCRRSLPELNALQQQGRQKGTLVVIPCNLDEDLWPRNVMQFLERNAQALPGFTCYRAQIGKAGIGTNLGQDIASFPTTLVIDRGGRLAARWSGYGEGVLVAEINRTLAEPAEAAAIPSAPAQP